MHWHEFISTYVFAEVLTEFSQHQHQRRISTGFSIILRIVTQERHAQSVHEQNMLLLQQTQAFDVGNMISMYVYMHESWIGLTLKVLNF